MHDEAELPVNAMTVDVEDYFHVSAFEGHIDRGSWDSLPCRVADNVDRILAIFDQHGVRATFFTLGWVAERYPALVRAVVAQGHEIASHGFSHTRVTRQSPQEFEQDVVSAKALLEDISGQAISGYRAPSYSIDSRNLWALEVLQRAGYRYSSSIYPVKHDLYGMPEAPRFVFRPIDGDLIEVPITTIRRFGRNFPCGGGGYFRLYPYRLSRWAIRQVNRREGQSCVFYFHPWELDVAQPRQAGVRFKTRFRHYLNLHRMDDRLRQLCTEFRWDRMDRVFAPALSAATGTPGADFAPAGAAVVRQ